MRGLQEQGPGTALRPVRGRSGPPARLNDGGQPVCQNCWHRDPRSWKPCAKCGNTPARRRGHRGRAGLPELPPGSRSSLQHLRVRRRRPDRHLAGDRHAGLRTVPQALDHLLALRHRGAAEGRHAARAALRALPQPRPGLLETVRVLPADLAAVDGGVHALLPGPETEAGLHPAGRRCRPGAGPAPGGHGPRRPSRPHAGLAEEPRRPPHSPGRRRPRRHHPRGARHAAAGPHFRPRAVDAGRRGRAPGPGRAPHSPGTLDRPGRRRAAGSRAPAGPARIRRLAPPAPPARPPRRPAPPASRSRTCATTSPPPRRSWTGSPHAG